jgi:hypothetical protein
VVVNKSELNPAKIGQYFVYYSAKDPSGNTSELMFRQVSVTFRTSLQKVYNTNSQIKIYPNPSSGKIFIESDESIKEIKVYQINGRLFKKISDFNIGDEILIDENGLYTIIIETEGGSYCYRLSVIK